MGGMSGSLHADEVSVDEATAEGLLADQCPDLAALPLRPAGHGTDNVMWRLGDDLLLRLPRTPDTARDVAKEQAWLPRLAPQLPLEVPVPVFQGAPGRGYPFPWSVYRWIQGESADVARVAESASLGRELAGFVRALHGIDLMGARRANALAWYRGDLLASMRETAADGLAQCRALPDLDLDLVAVGAVWADALAAPEPDLPHVWMHADLKPSNLIVRDGRLAAVIDFGGLSIGNPTCEHAAVWELSADARDAYRDELELDDDTWRRVRGWALVPALTGIPYYWTRWPEFARAAVEKVRMLLESP